MLIHESGLYVFEAKHYKGIIYGTDDQLKWTQYFRTTQNAYFQNPIKQNQYHISALKARFPDIKISSVIVFTNTECDLRVKCDDSNITICKLSNLRSFICSLKNKKIIMDADKINIIFKELSVFSPMQEKMVIINEKEIPFYAYLNDIIKDYQDVKKMLESTHVQKQKELKEEYDKKQEELQTTYRNQQTVLNKSKTVVIIGAGIICGICITICMFFYNKYKDYADQEIAVAQKELDDFTKKFKYVEDFNEGDLNFANNLAFVSEVVIEPSKDIDNTLLVSFVLTNTGNDYGICINSKSTIIVILKDGSVLECAIYNEKYPFRSELYLGSISSGSTCTILPHEFYNLSKDDIDYIKLSNLDVWTSVSYNKEIVLSGYEIEVYNSNK